MEAIIQPNKSAIHCSWKNTHYYRKKIKLVTFTSYKITLSKNDVVLPDPQMFADMFKSTSGVYNLMS